MEKEKRKYSVWLILLDLLIIASIVVSAFMLTNQLRAKADNEYIGVGDYYNASRDNPIELINQRTETSKKYSLGGNSYAISSATNTIHYKNNKNDVDEQWKDIDTTISKDGEVSNAPYDLEVYLSGLPGFHYVSKESGEFDIRLVEARQNSTSLTPIAHDTQVTPVIEGNTVTWYGLYPDVDVVLTATNTGVSLNRIIKSPSAPLEYDVRITELEKGVAQLKPIQPAEDANGQLIKMEEKPTLDGRMETLKLEVVSAEPQAIAYPIIDSTVVDEYVDAGADDGHSDTKGRFDNSTLYTKSGQNYSTSYDSFYRFDDIDLPVATIDYAKISLHGYTGTGSGGSGSPQTLIYANDVAEPSPPADRASHVALTRTSTGVTWDDSPLTSGSYNDSPDIKSVIQELNDSYAPYSSGAIMILHDNDGGYNQGYFKASSIERGSPAYLYIEYTEGGGEPSISNSPSSENLGVVAENTTYYAYGSAPSNPVEDGECTFTITNDGSITIDINIKATNFTGGDGWTLTSGSPGSGEVRLTIYYSGQNPASGVTVNTTDQLFYSSLPASVNNTIKWDFKLETGIFTDGVEKTSTITLTAVAS